jgi:glycosyltransferase involved in cell wall biosynthesis
MKLLVFAHKPPPHHGQSYMVQLLLERLGGDQRAKPANGQARSSAPPTGPLPVECYHVDCRFSDGIQDIGRVRPRKLFQLLRYCLEAVWCRFRYGVRNFLYVPAPGMRSALYRDWVVMAFCRPVFRRRVYYWQAAGLAEWLRTQARPWERWVSRRLLNGPDLSIVLGQCNRGDGEELGSKRVAFVPNAVPDPCPKFDEELSPQRHALAAARVKQFQAQRAAGGEPAAGTSPAQIFRVLFLSLCTKEKGLFDAVEATVRINDKLRGSNVRVKLTVCGAFWIEGEKTEFEDRIRQQRFPDGEPMIEYRGFVSGADKEQAFRESDCFCFPTYYPAESFPVALVEAMAFGLPVVATRWRMLPELLPPGYPGLVDPRAPDQIAAAVLGWLQRDYDAGLRTHFLQNYTAERFTARMVEALLPLDT